MPGSVLGAYGLSSFALVAPPLRNLFRKSPPSGSSIIHLASQSFNSHLLHPIRTQQAVITVKCSSGHVGHCLKPFKDCPQPSLRGQTTLLTVASADLTIWPQPCHRLQPLPLSSPAVSSHTFSPLLEEHLMLCSWPPASAYPLPQMVWLALPYLSNCWIKQHLLGKAFFLATVSPGDGRTASSPGPRLLGQELTFQPAPLRAHLPLGASGPTLLFFAPQIAQTLAHGISLSDNKKDWRPALHWPRCLASQHSPRNMSYQTFLALRCCRSFLWLRRLSWKEL